MIISIFNNKIKKMKQNKLLVQMKNKNHLIELNDFIYKINILKVFN